MKISWVCFLLIGAMLLSGCAITHDNKPASGIKEASILHIIDDPATREGFLEAMKAWLDEHGYKYDVLPANTNKNREGWVLTYNGKWSWDVSIYLAKAVIEETLKSGLPIYLYCDFHGIFIIHNYLKLLNQIKIKKKY